jgi:hypothetical protein
MFGWILVLSTLAASTEPDNSNPQIAVAAQQHQSPGTLVAMTSFAFLILLFLIAI